MLSRACRIAITYRFPHWTAAVCDGNGELDCGSYAVASNNAMGLLTQATAVPHSGAATDLVYGFTQGTFNESPTSNYSWIH